MVPRAIGLAAYLFLVIFCSSPPAVISWKCKGCSALQCKPSGKCSASDSETQPPAVSWFFYNDHVLQEAWAACPSSSCPLLELPCGHSHYSGTRTYAKYDVAISCELGGTQCVIGLPLPHTQSSSLSRLLQLSLTPGNLWIQVTGNASCGGIEAQLRCNGTGRMWLRGGMYTGQEQSWVDVASFRCVSCDSAVARWMPPSETSSALQNASKVVDNNAPDANRSSAAQFSPFSNNSIVFGSIATVDDDAGEFSPSDNCLPLAACLAAGQTASGMLLAIATACADEECHRYLLVSTIKARSQLTSHIFAVASIQRVLLERHTGELLLHMRSGPALNLKLPLSSCTFSQYLLLELLQHLVLLDDIATAALNTSCTPRASLVLHGDSVCSRAVDAAAAHHMAAIWHNHILHLQMVSDSHVSQADAEAMQLRLQIQARTSLCADEVHCDIICLSCDGAFIAATPSRIVVAKFPLDRPVHAHLLSRVSTVDTLADGVLRLFFVQDELFDIFEPYVDLPLQLCSQEEVEQFLPSIIAALEDIRTVSTPVKPEHKQHSGQSSVLNALAITSLSECWDKERVQWPQLLHSFVGLPCIDGAIALDPQESDIEIAWVHRVFSGHERKTISVDSRCISAVSLLADGLSLASSCGHANIVCAALNSSNIPAFVALLHSAMTTSAPHTLHHRAHANHHRHLQSISSAQQSPPAALDDIRANIDLACSFPVLYTGCGAAQCICLSASNLFVVSLLPTIPMSTSKTAINISAIVSVRTHDNGVLINLHDSRDVVLSVPSVSSIFLVTALQDITGTFIHRTDGSSNLDVNSDGQPFELEHVENTSNINQEHQLGTSFSLSGNFLELYYGNGTLQWREDLCIIGHFFQFDQNLIGITSVSADLLLQLQAVAQWVLDHCGVVLPVTTDVPGDDRFLHVINATHFSDINSSVASLHQAAVAVRKSSNCSDFNFGYDELKKCANSLPQNETFNSTELLQIFEPFAIASKKFSVHSSHCVQWDTLPHAGMRSPSDGNLQVEMWVSSTKSRRVLALSKFAIFLLSAITDTSCKLQVFPLTDIQYVRSVSIDAVLFFTRSSGSVPVQLHDFPTAELHILLTTANVWALRS